MNGWLGGVAVLLAIAAGGYMWAQSQRLEQQERVIAEQGASIGELAAVNAAQSATITELRVAKQRDDALVAGTAEKIDKLTTRIQGLDRRTQEALRNAPHLTLDSLLPAAAADALCMQWHAASGFGIGTADHQGNTTSSADARKADSAAADCGRWLKMTVRDAVEWNGLLLRHAGLEREDKAALRDWAKGSK